MNDIAVEREGGGSTQQEASQVNLSLLVDRLGINSGPGKGATQVYESNYESWYPVLTHTPCIVDLSPGTMPRS